MQLEVRLFATLRVGRFKKKMLTLPEGSSAGNLLGDLKIAKSELGILLVNGRHASPDQALAPEDVVSIFPSLGGG